MLMTKYFDHERQLKNYSMGSFRFGTLREYGGGERKGTRFSDHTEGRYERHYGKPGDAANNLKIGGLHIESFESISPAPEGTKLYQVWKDHSVPISVVDTFDTNIFCASLGGYDRKHHRIMMSGISDPSCPYEGNPDLTGWAEIDVEKFCNTLRLWIAKNTSYPFIKENPHKGFDIRPVEYNKKIEEFSSESVNSASQFSRELIDKLVL